MQCSRILSLSCAVTTLNLHTSAVQRLLFCATPLHSSDNAQKTHDCALWPQELFKSSADREEAKRTVCRKDDT
jgi:hypothetical protein